MVKTYEVKIGTTELKNLKKFEVERAKLWLDADRNMAGEMKATLIGVFPKLSIEFNYTTEAEAKAILALLEPAVLSVTYWDTKAGGYKTADYYAGDCTVPYWSKSKAMYMPFSVNLIAYRKTT